MFFVLSKLLAFFISPFNLLLVWIILYIVVKDQRWKKRLKWVSICWFLFFSNPYIIHKLTLRWQAAPLELKATEVYEAGIVLGSFVQYNKKEEKGYFSSASDRFLQVLRLYKLGHIKKIVVCGGTSRLIHTEFKEADFARSQLIDFGVPPMDILLENKSRNTFENASYAKIILDSAGIRGPYILVTSAMHIKRAEQVFARAGVPVISYPSNFTAVDFPLSFVAALTPSFNCMNQWEELLKEYIGLQVYRWTGKA